MSLFFIFIALLIESRPSNNSSTTDTFLGVWPIYFHSSTFSGSLFSLNFSYFPSLHPGDIIYLVIDKTRFYIEVPAIQDVQSNIAISIHEKMRRQLKISSNHKIPVYSCPRETAALNVIEVNILDGCLPRHEMWSLFQSLQDQYVYVNQQLQIDGCDIQVQNLQKEDKKKMYGGLITSSTNVIFYRSNCRMYIVVHITRDILCVDSSGYLRSEIIVNFCMKKIQELWEQNNSHHLITVMLYMSKFAFVEKTCWYLDIDVYHNNFSQNIPYLHVFISCFLSCSKW